ncbi:MULTISPECIES: GNAT family N-acetyltransferase [unclassified Methylobacterium]|uniref:GNAT family N-acetyltransferase n=1 Tax=unclassified Methylobacterium TaxID=2615210 RepID=UPI000A6E9F37|nr:MULTISPECIES: GNAT family N-acetyltransferase [unclassified Methylobacterium]USU34015.1 GNAT family N-acetyltransferase [Methylobacterium sp. OTU13CASTA1]
MPEPRMPESRTREPRSEPRALHPVIRRLWPSDAAAVEAYFLRLDPETRANRFMGTLSDAAALAYARRALRIDGVVFGGFVDGTLRALGELRPTRAPPSRYRLGAEAEAAFAVERGYRRNGLGHALFRRIAGAARNRGVRDLRVRCLSRNRPMQNLALRVGADLRMADGEAEGALHLARPTPVSLWQESVTEAFDFTLALAAA